MLGIPIQDCTAGYRCYRREVLENIGLETVQTQGYGFQVEMAYRVLQRGYKIVETPIIFEDRREGKSKMSKTIFFEAFTYVLQTRFGGSSHNTQEASHQQETSAPANDSVEHISSVAQK
jgi:dolichol-phosphate mannosyltransferase